VQLYIGSSADLHYFLVQSEAANVDSEEDKPAMKKSKKSVRYLSRFSAVLYSPWTWS
jgi:hypothetical protein